MVKGLFAIDILKCNLIVKKKSKSEHNFRVLSINCD